MKNYLTCHRLEKHKESSWKQITFETVLDFRICREMFWSEVSASQLSNGQTVQQSHPVQFTNLKKKLVVHGEIPKSKVLFCYKLPSSGWSNHPNRIETIKMKTFLLTKTTYVYGKYHLPLPVTGTPQHASGVTLNSGIDSMIMVIWCADAG